MDIQSSIVPVTSPEEITKALLLRAIGDVSVLKARQDKILQLRNTVMLEGIHYGPPYPSSKKECLLKPGAELLAGYFGLRPEFAERAKIERWDIDKPLFHYQYECRLHDIATSLLVGSGVGSCNSLEGRYRWRDAKRVCPNCAKDTLQKSKFAPKNAPDQPPGFYCYAKLGGCGMEFAHNDKRITEQEIGKVPNDDVFTLVNTIDKQAQKRAFLGAVLMTTGASTFFTQDVEDFKGHQYFGDPDAFEEGYFEELDSPAPSKSDEPRPAKSVKHVATLSTNGHNQAAPPLPSTGNGSSGNAETSGQPGQDEGDSVQPWPNDKDVRYVIKYVKDKLHITDEDILRYLHMDDLSVLDNWKRFENGGAAMRAIKAAMDAETEALKNAPPAQPKNNPFSQSGNSAPPRHQWTANDVAAMDGFCATFWDTAFQAPLLPDKVLASGEYIGWSTFQGGLPAARAALIQYAKEERLPIIVGEATFAMLPNKSSRTTFTNGLLEVVEYGRDRLRGLGADWKDYVDAWSTAGGKYVFDRARLPHLIVSWKLKQAESDGHEYLNCDGLKALEITETVPF